MIRLLLPLAFLLASAPAGAKPTVVATVGDLGAIAREVGGDRLHVITLARPAQDPHFVDARPNLVLDLARADLLFVVGLDLEVGWLPVLVTQSRNEHIQRGAPGYLDGSTLAELRDIPQQKLDRSMGDIHAGGNPHYTKDPRNAIRLAKGLAERLAEIDPVHAAGYREDASRFEKDLRGRIAAWEKALAPHKGTRVVTYHRSLTYFDAWVGFTEAAWVEPKPGLAPSIAHLAKVVAIMKAQNVAMILIEPWYPSATSEALAQQTGAKLVRIAGMTGEKERYSDHIEALVSLAVKALPAK